MAVCPPDGLAPAPELWATKPDVVESVELKIVLNDLLSQSLPQEQQHGQRRVVCGYAKPSATMPLKAVEVPGENAPK